MNVYTYDNVLRVRIEQERKYTIMLLLNLNLIEKIPITTKNTMKC